MPKSIPAFTLIEIIIVIAIMGFLATLSLGNFNDTKNLLDEQTFVSTLKNDLERQKNRMAKDKENCYGFELTEAEYQLTKVPNCKNGPEAMETNPIPSSLSIQENNIEFQFTHPLNYIKPSEAQTIKIFKEEAEYATIKILPNGLVVSELANANN